MTAISLPSLSQLNHAAFGKKNKWFTVFCLLSVIGLISLGFWQLKRLEWKNGITAQIERSKQEKNNYLASSNQRTPEYTFVTAFGTFEPYEEVLIQARFFKGAKGYELVTPMVQQNGTVLLVNRGWIPEDKKNEYFRKQPISQAIITGYVSYNNHPRAWYMPDNKPENDMWLYPNADEIVAYFKKKNPRYVYYPFILNLTAPDMISNITFKYPMPMSENIKLRNDHLQYAITWFALAFVVVVMYGFYIRKSVE
ncbi:MAG: SURF1 family protein [Proteobacteria bacterium]|nr:SURF1 family protein [Pseudomonadota bacterium]